MSLEVRATAARRRSWGGWATIAVVLLSASPAPITAAPNGKALFEERCAACHTVKRSEPEGMAPPLGGVVGRKVAGVAGWRYSPALTKLGGAWTVQRLDAFIADPQKVARGTSMGVQEPNPLERAAIIQHLKTLRP